MTSKTERQLVAMLATLEVWQDNFDGIVRANTKEEDTNTNPYIVSELFHKVEESIAISEKLEELHEAIESYYNRDI